MDKSRESRREILLVPIGKVLVDILGEIAVALRKSYKYHVHIGRSEEPANDMYSDERRQYDAEKLLAVPASRKRDSLVAVLGVVDADMFAGEKSFIFGLNKPEKGIAVIALSRLREEFYKKPSNAELFLRRAVTEAIFQVGMDMKLSPCIMKKCVLLPTTTLWRLDTKAQAFCEACQVRVENKLHPKIETEVKKEETEVKKEETEVEKEETEVEKEETEENTEDTSTEGPAAEATLAEPTEIPIDEKQPEDESEVPAELVEPEGPIAAEAAAMHTEPDGPEEPLDADPHETEK
jgi:predicted Zn-dependent protease